MNELLWSSGHLDWTLFSLCVFTALFWLGADVVWRIRRRRAHHFLAEAVALWLACAVMIVVMTW